jgi:hypothetical protein
VRDATLGLLARLASVSAFVASGLTQHEVDPARGSTGVGKCTLPESTERERTAAGEKNCVAVP